MLPNITKCNVFIDTLNSEVMFKMSAIFTFYKIEQTIIISGHVVNDRRENSNASAHEHLTRGVFTERSKPLQNRILGPSTGGALRNGITGLLAAL